MEVVAIVAAMQALVFVIAFGVTLAVSRARVVLLAGLVIAFVSAIVAAVVARGGDGSLFDFSPSEAFTSALLIGLFLYAGWALGVAAATRARSWAARRRVALPRDGDR